MTHIDFKKGYDVLDAGSYKSFFPLYLALKSCNVYAIDIDEKVNIPKKYAKYLGLEDLIDNGLYVSV